MAYVVVLAVVALALVLSWWRVECNIQNVSLLEDVDKTSSNSKVKVTVQITDVDGRIFGKDSVPFGTDIRLKLAPEDKNKMVSVIPYWCQLVSLKSKRGLVILQNGCGDGVIFPPTSGFIIDKGEALSPVFRAFDFSDDNHVKFRCKYVTSSSVDFNNSCKNRSSSYVLKTGSLFPRDQPSSPAHDKGDDSVSPQSVETRVIGLRLPEYSSTPNDKNSSSTTDVEYVNYPLYLRRLMFILAFFGLYLFIIAIFISLQIERNKLESLNKISV